MQLSFFDAPPVDAAPPIGGARSNGGVHLPKPDLDYRITIQDPIGFGGQIAKVKQNLEIIRLLKQLQAEKRQATPEEQKALVLYTGWGHTAQPFHPKPRGSNWLKLQEEMRPLFSDEEWAAAAASTINAHYTSAEVIRWMWQVVQQFGFTGGRILEPALGVGHFFGLMPQEIRANSRLFGCELDLLSGAIARHLYPSAQIFVGGFETATTWTPSTCKSPTCPLPMSRCLTRRFIRTGAATWPTWACTITTSSRPWNWPGRAA